MHRWHFGRHPGWGEFERMRREMDSLVNLFSRQGRTWSPLWRETKIFPLLNVIEKTDSFLVTAEIPGMKTEDLEIKVEGDTLNLKGERKPETIEQEASYHRRERATGTFQRSLTLPAKVDAEKVTANYKNGVLTVTLTKAKEALPKEITVTTE
jgi:HSP20 family protein